ncbi:MAG: hypothetical protein ACFFC7_17515 [Candidatus Hermodarchaeota archaeon]
MTENQEKNSKENADKKKKEPLSLKELSSYLNWVEKPETLGQETSFSKIENSSLAEHSDDNHSLSQSPPPSQDKPVSTVRILEEYNQHWREMPTPDKLPEYYRVWLHWNKKSRHEKLPNRASNDETEV